MEKLKPQIPEQIPDQPGDDEKRLSGRIAGVRGAGFVELGISKQEERRLEEEEKERKDKEEENKEKWDKKREELFALWRQISKRSSEDPDFARKVSKERMELSYLINGGISKNGYGIPQDYAAFHYFAGGSWPSYKKLEYDKLDLPGKYSIVGFYERCIADDFPLQEGRSIDE